jgi:hypothetical protein
MDESSGKALILSILYTFQKIKIYTEDGEMKKVKEIAVGTSCVLAISSWFALTYYIGYLR